MERIKIAFGDLRHSTSGRNFVFMPLGISYIASYLIKRLGADRLDIRFYDNPENLIEDLKSWRPAMLALSHYCWNAELSSLVYRHAKKINPQIICIAGGPEFPLHPPESESYLRKRPEIDFFVFLEAEQAFSDLVVRLLESTNAHEVQRTPVPGVMSLHPETGKLVAGKPCERIKDLDVIPSPYLSGLMDRWFTGQYAPSIETSRGCPFTCGFCYAGQKWFGEEKKVATFSVERIRAELTYIAERMKNFPHILLSICDSNFGMYERDESIAEHCRMLQEKYGWPNAFDVTTGKMNYDRILNIASILKNKMHVTCSVQSLNPATLTVIKRKNLPFDQYKAIQMEIKKREMLSIAELIMPMPEETKESFLQSMKSVMDIGVEHVVPYTTMLLKGTFLASEECRAKYKLVSRFRILPRQFGSYAGEKCFEIEEVCIATNTMPFDDYLELRGFALISSFFSGEIFDLLHKHLQGSNLSRYDFYHRLWKKIGSGSTPLSSLYQEFLRETREELWNSPEDIDRFFNQKGNYERLLTGRLGDNLIRKYTTALLLEQNVAAIELAYDVLTETANGDTHFKNALDASKRWALFMRNLEPVFKTESYRSLNTVVTFDHDVLEWCAQPATPLANFKKEVQYRFFYDNSEIDRLLGQSRQLYGEEKAFRVGKTLINWSARNFLCKCEKI